MQVSASVNYHVQKDEPQAFEFDVDGVVGKQISPELVITPVRVNDLRGQERLNQFGQEGIAFVEQPSAVNGFEGSHD